jgi:hypothetical protein
MEVDENWEDFISNVMMLTAENDIIGK